MAGDKLQQIRFKTVFEHKDANKILDFGCGAGSFVKYVLFVDEGLEIAGFDINPYANYHDVTALLNGFNTVTFWDSLEHVQDPKNLIEGLKAKHIFISTPSIDDFNGDYTKFHHYYPGEHVHYFNKQSLNKLLESCGYHSIIEHYKESEIRTSGGDKNILTMGFKRGRD
jgi:SAM-dependent methyltransferase